MQKQARKIIILLVCCFVLTSCSNSESHQANVSITIKDLTAPTITIKKKSYSITEGDSFKIEDCYSVSDNLTKESTVEIDDGGFSNKKAGTYTIKITTTDESENVTEDSFTVEVKEKPKPTPTPTPTPEATPEVKKSNNSSTNNNQSSGQSQQPAQQDTSTQPQQEQSQQNSSSSAEINTYTEPSTKTDGPYEDANACRTAARSKGALSYRCYDQNGQTYLEWEE